MRQTQVNSRRSDLMILACVAFMRFVSPVVAWPVSSLTAGQDGGITLFILKREIEFVLWCRRWQGRLWPYRP